MPRIEQVNGLSNLLYPRLFVIGDSFNTIRRSGTESAANLNINGRFTSASGYNMADFLARSFDTVLAHNTITNFAREGALAFRDWTTTAAWSAINPIPGANSQFDQLVAANPSNTITNNDLLFLMLGTNDKVSSADTTAADGGAKPTATQVSNAIVAVLNRALTHGFRNFIVMHPEGKWFSTVSPILFPAINALQASNRSSKFVQCYADTAMLEFANPYHPDNLHPNDISHQRLGEVLTDSWQQHQITDKTQSFLVSTKGSSTTNPREIGFNNFNPNSDYVRFRFVDAFNCMEAQTNRGMTLRSYNGLNICAAWEAQDPIANGRIPVGAGKADPVMALRGNFWEHQALLLLDNVSGSPAPAILARNGGTDNFKLNGSGSIVIDTADSNAITIVGRTAGAANVILNNATAGLNNPAQFVFQNNGVTSWSFASSRAGGASTNNSLQYFNNQLGSSAFFINGDNNFLGIGTASPSQRVDIAGGLNVQGNVRVNGTIVLGNRNTGWSTTVNTTVGSVATGTQAMSATATPDNKALLGNVTLAAAYTPTTLAGIINAQNARINALINMVLAHGLAG